ncbi:hypothetical protein BS50DRAFT_486767 [Corynespora cassiicola Philippines]|uniref:Uncharacterized protein n=1 Tax=Corynespora cassiicola Philippines TaxID=1448308 RepID=A0A2T2NZQ4_CORCC|nr:hypothetical protein BS50DRAFT_486767 [Corynespora cassiicola Philippines]
MAHRDPYRIFQFVMRRYRVQAFMTLAYHFFLPSYMLLDVFLVLFILVTNYINRRQAFPNQLIIQGMRIIADERRMLLH